jgi:glycosyltransferase involved in cell wall biosynthesis
MVKLLIVYNKVWSYREKIFDLINQQFDLTVAFTDPQFIDKKFSFKTIYIPGKWKGPVYVHDSPLHPLCAQYDAVLAYGEIRSVSIMKLGFISGRKYSLSYWGIGVSASYANRFDENKKWDFIRYFLSRRAESLVFYSDYPVEKYVKAGFKREQLFVAHNTTNVSDKLDLNVKRDSFLFVGTLYKQKGFEILLEAYAALKKRSEVEMPVLNIIGEGPERQFIEQWIAENQMEDQVFLHGAIYDTEILRSFYEKAIACVSPNQAGLSVLTTMGYATTFVTEKNAITGGEIFNIKDMHNGIIYEGGAAALEEKLDWIIHNKQKVIDMGMRAKEHYDQNRTPQQMADALMDAVRYALKVKNNE